MPSFYLVQTGSRLREGVDLKLAVDFASVLTRLYSGGDTVVKHQALIQTRCLAVAQSLSDQLQQHRIAGGPRYAAKRGLPTIAAFGIGWLYPVCPVPGFAPRETPRLVVSPKTVRHPGRR